MCLGRELIPSAEVVKTLDPMNHPMREKMTFAGRAHQTPLSCLALTSSGRALLGTGKPTYVF